MSESGIMAQPVKFRCSGLNTSGLIFTGSGVQPGLGQLPNQKQLVTYFASTSCLKLCTTPVAMNPVLLVRCSITQRLDCGTLVKIE